MKFAVLITSLLVGVRAVAIPENDQTNTYQPPQSHQGNGADPGESKFPFPFGKGDDDGSGVPAIPKFGGDHFKAPFDGVLMQAKKALGWKCPNDQFKKCVKAYGSTFMTCAYAILVYKGSSIVVANYCAGSLVVQSVNTPRVCLGCVPSTSPKDDPANNPGKPPKDDEKPHPKHPGKPPKDVD